MNNHSKGEHAAAWALLPWHAQGHLEADEAALVAEHLRTCASCRAELAWQRQLHGAARGAEQEMPVPDVDAALARLLPRLDEPPARPPRRGRVGDALAALADWLRRPLVLPAALALAVVALAVPLSFTEQPGYEGLGPVPVDGGDATVMFRPGTNAADTRRILDATGAAAVHGPTAAGAYVLDIAPARRASVLERLRAEPAVLMAEPLDAADAP